ncbi:MAG: hypothetical protein CL398_12575 [Acidiferrobacteraceae bacterium]|nr:hypothetical protein [Acidiferrobacteraceae bacterium]
MFEKSSRSKIHPSNTTSGKLKLNVRAFQLLILDDTVIYVILAKVLRVLNSSALEPLREDRHLPKIDGDRKNMHYLTKIITLFPVTQHLRGS